MLLIRCGFIRSHVYLTLICGLSMVTLIGGCFAGRDRSAIQADERLNTEVEVGGIQGNDLRLLGSDSPVEWLPVYRRLSLDVSGNLEQIESELLRESWPTGSDNPEKLRKMQRLLAISQGGAFAIGPAEEKILLDDSGVYRGVGSETDFLGRNLPPIRKRVMIAMRELGIDRGGENARRFSNPILFLDTAPTSDELDFILDYALSTPPLVETRRSYIGSMLREALATRPLTRTPISEPSLRRITQALYSSLEINGRPNDVFFPILFTAVAAREPSEATNMLTLLRRRAAQDSSLAQILDSCERTFRQISR